MKYKLKNKYYYMFRYIILEIKHDNTIEEVACFKYMDYAYDFIDLKNRINRMKRVRDKSVTKKIYIIINVLETDPEGNIEIEDDLING